jgi:hypothetical protein
MTRVGMTVVALSLIPALLAAQTDSSRMRGADSTRGRTARQQSSSGTIEQNRSGRSRGQRLTRDQIGQLQTALQQANCDPGTIDSVMGAHTRQAMSCARQHNNITSNNPNDLYRSLNLNFSNADSLNGANTGARSSSGMKSGGRARGNGRTRGDSTGMRSTRGDSTRRPSTRRDTTRPR